MVFLSTPPQDWFETTLDQFYNWGLGTMHVKDVPLITFPVGRKVLITIDAKLPTMQVVVVDGWDSAAKTMNVSSIITERGDGLAYTAQDHGIGASVQISDPYEMRKDLEEALNALYTGRVTTNSQDVADGKFADITERDAYFTSPVNGNSAYITSLGLWTDYIAGAWTNRATGSTANATTSAAGKGQIGTQPQVDAGDPTAGGNPIWVAPDTLKSNLSTNFAQSSNLLKNLTISTSRTANAETISLKTLAWADPSAANPITINFRNSTEATGDYTALTLTAATSITIPSTATMGMTNGVIYRLWLVGINDWGTFRLGVINTQKTTGIQAIKDDLLVSSILMDTASDNPGVIYTDAAATTKAMRVLGYLEYTLATAGTWVTAPSKIQVYSPAIKLPGDIVQFLYTIPAPSSGGWPTMPADWTIPQSGEGNEITTLAVTPTCTVNKLVVEAKVNVGGNINGDLGAALFQDAIAGALAAAGSYAISSTHNSDISLFYVARAATTSSTTFKIRAGLGSAGNVYWSGNYSSVQNNYLKITELMV